MTKKTSKKKTNKKKKETIEQLLSKPLPKNAIKQREGGRGIMLDYLEGWWVKQNANRIFGIVNWDFKPIWEYMKHVPLPDYKNRKGEMKKTGLYTIPGELTVTIDGKEVIKGDIGSTQYYGAEGKDMAIKGCVTDALKRCFSPFGEQFGLLLYDKGGNEVQSSSAGTTTAGKGYPTQKELMKKHGMDTAQVPPKCPNCGATMLIYARKDKSGIFWSCKNWRSKGCKAYNIDEVDIEGTITMKKTAKQDKLPAQPENKESVDVEDIPF